MANGGHTLTVFWPVDPSDLWVSDVPCVAGRPLKPHRFITPAKPLPLLPTTTNRDTANRTGVRLSPPYTSTRQTAHITVLTHRPESADIEQLARDEVLR